MIPGRSSLRFESLEERVLLANITITDAFLVDGSGSHLAGSPVVGQKIGVRANWATIDLPGTIADYQVEFRVDGVPLSQ